MLNEGGQTKGTLGVQGAGSAGTDGADIPGRVGLLDGSTLPDSQRACSDMVELGALPVEDVGRISRLWGSKHGVPLFTSRSSASARL